jgi:hypothetical protein
MGIAYDGVACSVYVAYIYSLVGWVDEGLHLKFSLSCSEGEGVRAAQLWSTRRLVNSASGSLSSARRASPYTPTHRCASSTRAL